MNKVKSIISLLLSLSLIATSCVSVKNVYDGPIEIIPLTSQEIDSNLIVEKKNLPSKEKSTAVFKVSKRRKYKAKTRRKRTTVKGTEKESWYAILGISAISLGVMCLYYSFCEEEEDPYGNNNYNYNNNYEELKPLFGSSKADAIVFLSSAGLAFLSYKHIEMEDRESSVYVETGYKEFTNSIPIRNTKIEVVLKNKRKDFKTNINGELNVNLNRDLGLRYHENNKPIKLNFKFQNKQIKNSLEFTPSQWLPIHAKINNKNTDFKLLPNVQSEIFKPTFLGEEYLILNIEKDYSEVLYGDKKLWLHKNEFDIIYKAKNFQKNEPELLKTELNSKIIAEQIIIKEGNLNDKLEGNEKINISFKIRNKSKDFIYNIQGKVIEKNNIKGIEYDKNINIGNLKPLEEKIIKLKVKGNKKLESGRAAFEVYLEDINYNSAEIVYGFPTEAYYDSRVVLNQYSEFTYRKVLNKKIATVHIQVKNIHPKSLERINLKINLLDQNVLSQIESFSIRKLKPNEVRNVRLQFLIEKPLKDEKLDFKISASEYSGRFGSEKLFSFPIK